MKSQKLTKRNKTGTATEWFIGKSSDEKKEFEQYLQNSSRLFDTLREMIQKRYDDALTTRDVDYDIPSWSHRQAHLNGRLDALEEIYKLLP